MKVGELKTLVLNNLLVWGEFERCEINFSVCVILIKK